MGKWGLGQGYKEAEREKNKKERGRNKNKEGRKSLRERWRERPQYPPVGQ